MSSAGPSGAAGLRLLAEQLGKIPVELRAQLRPALRRAGERVRRDAASRASWSSRIPRSLKVSTHFAGRNTGIYVRASEAIAPHARAYEGLTDRRSVFRHPVFGNDELWVAQATRPFLLPALRANRSDVVSAIEEAIDTAARAGGFR